MVEKDHYILSISKEKIKQIRQKHPETNKRGGIQKFFYRLLDLALMEELDHEEYIPKAKEKANQ